MYSETHPPSEIERDLVHDWYWKKIVSLEALSGSCVWPPQSRNIPPSSTAPDSDTEENNQHDVTPPDDTEHLEISRQEAHEGGNMLIVKLLAWAVPTSDSQHTIPTHYKDIACLPVQQQLQWRAACWEELEALQKRQVYELIDLSQITKQSEIDGS